jgi:hypothetical protein
MKYNKFLKKNKEPLLLITCGLVLCFLIYICNNKQIYENLNSCPNCSFITNSDSCNTCSNCGWCENNGTGSCKSGSQTGPTSEPVHYGSSVGTNKDSGPIDFTPIYGIKDSIQNSDVCNTWEYQQTTPEPTSSLFYYNTLTEDECLTPDECNNPSYCRPIIDYSSCQPQTINTDTGNIGTGTGSGSSDTVTGSGSSDTVTGSGSSDTVTGSGSSDTVTESGSSDTVTGTGSNDTCSGSNTSIMDSLTSLFSSLTGGGSVNNSGDIYRRSKVCTKPVNCNYDYYDYYTYDECVPGEEYCEEEENCYVGDEECDMNYDPISGNMVCDNVQPVQSVQSVQSVQPVQAVQPVQPVQVGHPSNSCQVQSNDYPIQDLNINIINDADIGNY